MKTYSEFRPTSYDGHISVKDREHWLVAPVMRNRDSECLDESNWDVGLALLQAADADGEDHEVHRFGHWACGWFEIILVRPDSNAAKVAEQIATSLANYPILDEDDLSDREFEAAQQTWRLMRQCERLSYMREHPGQFHGQGFRELLAQARGEYFHGAPDCLIR